jgi:hypothetical protein
VFAFAATPVPSTATVATRTISARAHNVSTPTREAAERVLVL